MIQKSRSASQNRLWHKRNRKQGPIIRSGVERNVKHILHERGKNIPRILQKLQIIQYQYIVIQISKIKTQGFEIQQKSDYQNCRANQKIAIAPQGFC